MRKSKFFLFIIACLMLVVAGCSDKEKAGTEKNENELVAWTWSANDEIMEEYVTEFEKDHPGFKLKIEIMGSGNSFNDKLLTMLQSGGKSLPDLLLLEDNVTQRFLAQYASYFADLNKLGFEDIKSNYIDFKIDVSTIDDSVYGFPYDAGPTAIYYRKDMFEKSGIDIDKIATWADFIEAGKKIKEDQGVKLLAMDQGDDSLVRIMMNQQGTSYFDDAGKPILDSKEMEKSLEILKAMNDEDLLSKTTGWDPWVTEIMSGNVASIPMASWFALNFESIAEDQKGKWAVMNLPAVEEGGNRYANFGGSQYLITEKSENKELAFEFLKGLTSSKGIAEFQLSKAIFPAANVNYETDIFTQDIAYFEQPIWQLFAADMAKITPINYTANFVIAKDEIANMQQRVFTGESIDSSIKKAQEKVISDIN